MQYFYLYSTLAALCFSTFFGLETFAVDNTPRDGLRLELLFNSGVNDTSGNGRMVTSTGVGPFSQIDSLYGVSYAQFTGSGGLKINTAWSATGVDDFSISFWTKISPDVFDDQYSGYFGFNGPILVSGTYAPYSPVRFPTTLLVAKTGEKDSSGLHLTVNNAGKCALRSTGESQRIYGWAWGSTGYEDIPAVDYTKLGSYGGVRSGIFTSMQDMFDCSGLKDNKWHNIILRKQSGKIEFFLDQNSIGKITSTATISRIVGIGNLSSFSMDPAIYGHLAQGIQNKIFNNHYLRGGITNVRIYSRALNDDEINILSNELSYTQGNLNGAVDIQLSLDKYVKPNLYFSLKGISTNLSKENVVYQYAVGTGTFNPIDLENINNISTNTGSLAYQVRLDLSTIADGKITITLRVKNGEMYQNIGTIGFTKNDTVYGIMINQPDTVNAPSKNISATTNSGGILYYYLTRGAVCDSSISTWDEYSDLIFTAKTDNLIRVCYKAIFPTVGKTIYKLSDPIQGITVNNALTTSTSLFADYSLWSKSLYPKSNDSANMILELLGVSGNASQGTINGATMTDINGDGLVDFLYSRSDINRRAIIVNNGKALDQKILDKTKIFWIFYKRFGSL